MQPTGFSGGTLYFAYGANLCRAHMALWCPEAVPLVRAVLRQFRVVFRPWADIEAAPGDAVPGALYEVTARDLASLDAYKEHPTLYERVHVRVHGERSAFDAMAYRMATDQAARLPDADYLNLVLAGYADWGLDVTPLSALAARVRAAQGDRPPESGLPDVGPGPAYL